MRFLKTTTNPELGRACLSFDAATSVCYLAIRRARSYISAEDSNFSKSSGSFPGIQVVEIFWLSKPQVDRILQTFTFCYPHHFAKINLTWYSAHYFAVLK